MVEWGEVGSGLEAIHAGMTGILNLENDPDETLQVAVTKRELALITFALFFPWRIFPEISPEIAELCEKLIELTEAQEFLP